MLATRSLAIHAWDQLHEINIDLCDQAAWLAELHGYFGWAIEIEMIRIDLLLYEGQYGRALEHAQRVLGHVRRRKLDSWRVDVTVVTAVLHYSVGRFADASRYFNDLAGEVEPDAVSDLGRTTFIAALNAIDAGVAFDEVRAMFADARQAGAATYERYRTMIEFGESRLAAREHGIMTVLDGLVVPESVDISIATEMPLWLARSGTLEEEPAAVERSVELVQAFAHRMAPDQLAWAVVCDEVALHGAAQKHTGATIDWVARFQGIARRWDELGCRIHALRASMSGIVLQSRMATSDAASLARSAMKIADELRQLGALADLEVLAACTSGIDDGSVTRIAKAFDDSRALASITPEVRRELLQATVEFSLPAGQAIYERGERPEAFYLIASGGVRGVVVEDGRELTVDVLGPGDIFGVLQPDGDVAPAQFETTEPVSIIAISPARVGELRRTYPDFATAVDRELETQRTRANELAAEIAYAPVPQRLARLICRLDERFGHPRLQGSRIINRRITQGDLATMIGTTRKSVALILGDMRSKGIIDLDRKRIVILDAAALKAATGQHDF